MIRMVPTGVLGLLLLNITALTLAASVQQPGETGYHDESVMPASVIGERITSLIETLNSGDPERVERYIRDECTVSFQNLVPMEEHLSGFASTHKQWGEVTFHGIRTYEPPRQTRTVVTLKDRNFCAWRVRPSQLRYLAQY